MNMLRLSTRLAVGVCLVQLISCQKNMKSSSESLEFQTSGDAAVVSEINDCKLRTVTHEIPQPPGTPSLQIKGTFVYHPDGLPDNLTYTNPGTGNPGYYFIYDAQRRLKELRIGYSKTSIVEAVWHKYGYNASNQIVADTLFNPGDPNDPVGFPSINRRIYAITYDAQNRISSQVVKNVDDGTSRTEMFTYDSRGNLVVDGWASSRYDNQKSIYRAHPLFQFIHRNYSVNNAAPQDKYNAKGFPLSNNPMNTAFFNAYPSSINGTNISRITYDCDGFNPPNEFLNCKLRTVTHEFINAPGTPNLEIKGTFVYHPDGLPERLTYNNTGSGNPNYYFLYDSKRRLRELRVGYDRNTPGDGGPWHRYGYNHLDQITADTIFNFTSTDPASGMARVISTLTYDGTGRVVKEVKNWYSGGGIDFTETLDYKYDGRGNLIVNGWPSSSYDNKVSIFRSHTVFQFIHRNYSKNNAAVQPRYNSKGLPLSNKPMNDAFFNAYPQSAGGTAITKANYDCP